MNMTHKWIARAIGISILPVLVLAAQAASAGAQATTTVRVQNTRTVPVVVYLARPQFDSRLGTVAPGTVGVLRLPRWLENGEKVQFIVHPEGGYDMSPEQDLTIGKGHSIFLYVPQNDVGFVPLPARPTIQNPRVDAATVTVDNPRNHPVVVFVENGDFDYRIGTVDAQSTTTLVVPKALTMDRPDVDIFVHVEGGSDLSSHIFALGPHAHLMVDTKNA